MEPPPRTRILMSASGSPSVVTTETPAIFPERAWLTVVTGCSVSFSEPTEATEPRRSRLLTVAYPTTTVSSRTLASSSITTSMTDFPATGTVTAFIPIIENWRTAFEASGTLMAYSPSSPVVVPVWVPWIKTNTPVRGSPLASFTVPFTSWASSATALRRPARRAASLIENLLIGL